MRVCLSRRINRNTGTTTLHWLCVDKVDGVTRRRYIRKADKDMVFYKAFRARMDRAIIKGERWYAKHERERAREIKGALGKAGLNVRSRRKMCRSLRDYLTLETARYRFQFIIDDDLRALVGTPENLLELDIRADSLMHSFRARRIKGVSAKDCFALALEEHLEKRQSD